MKPNKKQWIFYVIAGSEVIPNEVAAHYEWQAITFIPLVMIVAWATIRFLSAGKLEG